MARISVSDITNNSVRVRITGLDTSYSLNDRTVAYYFEGDVFSVAQVSIGARVSSSPYATLRDLDSDTRYDLEAVIDYTKNQSTGEKGTIYLYESFRTALGRPGYFYWINSRMDLTDVPDGEPVSRYITASLWRELQDNVNEVREYKGYRAYSFSRVSRGDIITAYDYNDIVDAIQGISGYGRYLSSVSRGDKITRRVMQKLQDELNAVE